MREKRKSIIWIIILSLCIQIIGVAANGEAAGNIISMTEFYDGYIRGGSTYVKTIGKETIVTISDVKEMKYFLYCLNDPNATDGISFRQEADIFFSSYTYSYNYEEKRVEIYSDGKLLGVIDQKGKDVSSTFATIWSLGLQDAYILRETNQAFSGTYNGQGHTLGGFILTGSDTRYNGIFGCVTEKASVFNLTIRHSLLLNACGTFAGCNEGTMTNCTAEYIVGLGYQKFGGIVESNCGVLRCCKLNHSTLLCTAGIFKKTFLGGITGSIFYGEVSNCAVEDSRMISYDRADIFVGGIAGFMSSGVLSDCANFGSCSVPKEGENCIAGGIVAHLSTHQNPKEVYNCISAGSVIGKCVGGIIGKADLYENVTGERSPAIVKNCVSLSKVDGSIAGGLVGEIVEGNFLYNYYYDKMVNGNAVGANISGSLEACYAVNSEQVYGKTSATVIDENGAYSNKKKLLDALNSWAGQNGYLNWREGKLGYPVLVSQLGEEAPAGDYVLDDNEDIPPENTPGVVETPKPTSTPGAVETPKPTSTPGITPSPNPGNSSEQNVVSREDLITKNLKVGQISSRQVRLIWNKNKYADGYQILRSAKKDAGYQVIGKVSPSKLFYTDKKARSGHTYYYMVKAYKKNEQKIIYGEGQRKKIEVAWFMAPKIRLNKGVTSEGKTYVQVVLNQYSGSYVEVYFRASGKRYVRAPLKSERIAFYKGKLRFSYKQKAVLYCKTRTYQIKRGEKRYSMFSAEKKIRL